MANIDPILIKAKIDPNSLDASSRQIVEKMTKAAEDADAALQRIGTRLKHARPGSRAEADAQKDYARARRGSARAEKEAVASAKKLGTAMKVATDEQRAFSDGFVQTLPVIGPWLTGMSRMAVGVGLVRNAFKVFIGDAIKGIINIGDEFTRLRDISLSAEWFGVAIQQGKDLQAVLSDVKTEMGALQLATELTQVGLDPQEIQQFGRTINVLAAQTGQAKDTIEKALKSAQVTDRQLAILGKNRLELKNFMLQLEVGAGGRDLDANERVKALIQFLNVTKKTELALGKLGKANPFRVMQQQVKTNWETIKKNLAPALFNLEHTFSTLGATATKWAVAAGQWFTNIFKGQGFVNQKANQAITNLKAEIAQRKKNAAAQKATDKKLFDLNKKMAREWVSKRDDLLKEANDKRVAEEKKALDKINALRAKNRARLRDQAKNEALQEMKSRQRQSRALLRNFGRTALGALGRSGVRGIGQVIAGMSQAVELAKVFSSTMGGKWTAKAKEIFALTLEAGRGGLAKLIAGEKQRTNQMKAQLSVSKEFQQNVGITNKLLNHQKTITQAQFVLRKGIGILSKSGVDKAKKMVVQLKTLLGVITKEGEAQKKLLADQRKLVAIRARQRRRGDTLSALEKEAGLLDKLRKLREQNLRISGFIVRDTGKGSLFNVKMAEIELKKIESRVLARSEELLVIKDAGSQKRLQDQIFREVRIWELVKLRIKALKQEAAQKKLNADQAARELKINREKAVIQQGIKLDKARADIVNLRRQFSPQAGVGPMQEQLMIEEKRLQIASKNIEIMRQRVALAKEPATKAAKQTELDTEIELLKIGRERLKVLKANADLERFKASMIGSTAIQVAQGASDAIGQLFTDMVAEPENAMKNFGATLLSVIGDMAFKLAGFAYAQAALWAFTPGMQGNAVGLVAAGIALTAIGGLLKGVSALVGKKPEKPAKAKSKRTKDGVVTPPLRGEGGPTTVNNFYNSVPWRKTNAEQDYREFRRWDDRMQRQTGKRRQMR